MKKDEKVIENLLKQYNFSHDFYQMVVKFLKEFNYHLTEKDDFSILDSAIKSRDELLDYYNITEISKRAIAKLTVMTCANFLLTQMNDDLLKLEDISNVETKRIILNSTAEVETYVCIPNSAENLLTFLEKIKEAKEEGDCICYKILTCEIS